MQVKKTLVSLILAGLLPFAVSTVTLGQIYYVQPGDSLYSIAARYGTSISQLQNANNLGSASIYPGQVLQIQSGATGSAASGGASYTVKPGDSLYLIAKKLGVTVDSLKQANRLNTDSLNVGQVLVVSGAAANGSVSTYQVQNGDTLYLIAKKMGLSVDSLIQTNGLGNNSNIYPGQVLKLPQKASGSSYGNNYALSQSDLDLLARLVTAESDGEPFSGQVAVAATILNRLKDPRYPKTIPGIIYMIDNGRYQYSPVLDGRIDNPASSSAYQAAQQALSGWDPSKGANGFYNPVKTVNQWVRSQTVTAVIGNHVFFDY